MLYIMLYIILADLLLYTTMFDTSIVIIFIRCQQLTVLFQLFTVFLCHVFLGFATAKGSIVRSILFPKPVNLKFYTDSIKFILILAAIGEFEITLETLPKTTDLHT